MSFRGLNIGYSGLVASQRNLQVTGHNISNANTVGYSRQRVMQESIIPEMISDKMQVGKGVDAAGIFQIRDRFLDARFRDENTKLGYWSTKQQTTEELEAIFNEISDSGLQHVMDQFWNAWQEVAKDPQSLTARGLLKERAIAFCETVKHIDHQLAKVQNNIDTEIRGKVQKINEMTERIADLNKAILMRKAAGEQPNDFLDQRNHLLDELAQIVPIRVIESGQEQVTVTWGGHALVDESGAHNIEMVDDASKSGQCTIQWEDTGQVINLSGSLNRGELKAFFDARDGWLQQKREELNQLVWHIAKEVNACHQSGKDLKGNDGEAFFKLASGNEIDSDEAPYDLSSQIVINPILDDLDRIAAASADGGAGNNTNALEIAKLRTDYRIGDQSLDNYYRSLIANLGLQGLEARTNASNQVVLCQEINNQRQSISGASLDEEMTNMIKFQHSYNAAARIVNAVDEMLDRIINRTGVVGR